MYVSFVGDNRLTARVDANDGSLLGIYQGSMVDDVPHGKGCLKYSESEEYDGWWQAGLAHGQGKLVSAAYQYEGSFRQGLFDGQGRLSINGKGVYEGMFGEGLFNG